MRKIKTIDNLVEKSADIVDDILSGKLNRKDAHEINSAYLNVIKAMKVKLEYSALRKEKPTIPFLNCQD